MDMSKKLSAEFFGTFWLVFGGCGSAIFAAGFPELGIGFLGVAFAFGLTVLTMAYAIGHISGCHLNPAVSIGLWAGKRFSTAELVPYIIAQVVGGAAAAGVLYLIVSGQAGFEIGGFATDSRAPAGFAPLAIGLGLTLIHLIGIPITNLSVNPARSTGPALVVGGWAMSQLWLFWLAPILGGLFGGKVYRCLFGCEK